MTKPNAPPPLQWREMTITRAEGGESETIELALSSEHPVERVDWWTGTEFREVLEHTEDAIDLTYATGGLPLLLDHDTREQVGILEDVRLDEDGRLRGTSRFSRSQRGQEIEQDVRDGIRSRVSVGYVVSEWKKTEKKGERATWRAVRWTPMEASLVPIPADPTVGVGRSVDGATLPVAVDSPAPNAAPKAEERSMSETPTNAATGNGAAPSVQVRADHDGDQVTRELAALAQQTGMQDRLPVWISERRSLDSVRGEIIATLKERIERGPQFAPRVDLSEQEQKQYSFSRAILSASDGSACFEREVSEAIGANLPAGYRSVGSQFFVPTHVRNTVPTNYQVRQLMQRGGLYNAATYGAEAVFDVPGTFIDLLRNRSIVMQAGATVMSGLTSPVTMPKQTAAVSASWTAENPTAAVSVTEATFSTVSLTPKTLMAATKFSKQFLRQASIDTESFVRNDIARVHALAVDLAALNGSGSSNQPTGILQNTSCNSVAIGTNGGAPTYAHLNDMVKEVEVDNADLGSQAFVTNPKVKYKLRTTQDFTNNGSPVWTGGVNGRVAEYPAWATNQVPSNLTKGTSTTVCSAIVFGSWAQELIGEWGALELVVDPYTLAGSGMIAVTSFQMIDIALRYPEAFCYIKDATTT